MTELGQGFDHRLHGTEKSLAMGHDQYGDRSLAFHETELRALLDGSVKQDRRGFRG